MAEKKLSEYIREGVEQVTLKREVWLEEKNGKLCGCPIGAALLAKFGKEDALNIVAKLNKNDQGCGAVLGDIFPVLKDKNGSKVSTIVTEFDEAPDMDEDDEETRLEHVLLLVEGYEKG